MLYNQNDMLKLKKQQRNILVICAVFTFIMIFGFVVLLKYRLKWPSVIEFTLWVFGLVTFWALWQRPLMKYRSFVKRAITGVGLDAVGVYIRTDDNITEIDGHNYRILYFSEVVEDRTFERKVYFDTAKELPQLAEGKEYTYRTSDNYAVKLESVE